MLNLLLATIFSASFGLVVRYAQGRKCNIWAVGAVNYVIASLFHLSRHLMFESAPVAASTWIIGLLGGVCYVTAFLLFFPLIALRGVAISTAVVRLSSLIPVVVAIIFWKEHLAAWQATGGLLALLSLPMLTLSGNGQGERLSRRAVLVLGALYVVNGLCLLAVRGFRQTQVEGQESLFLAVLFGTAALGAVAAWLSHRDGSSRHDIIPGVALGLCNALGNLTLVMALTQLPSVVVFPFQAAMGVVYTAIMARVMWGERITRLETAGMFLAIVAVVCINLG